MLLNPSKICEVNIRPERVRLLAYLLFWVMVLLAGIITKLYVKEDLNESAFVKIVGYNNICILWDYEPARTVTAMFYAFVETALVGYVMLNFFQMYIAHEENLISKGLYRFTCIIFPIQLVLVLWFRMIFMHTPDKHIIGHSLGFYGLIIALTLISLQNILYLNAINRLLTSFRMAIGYVIALAVVSIAKIIFTFVFFSGIVTWDGHSLWVPQLGHGLDITWMVLAAVLPVFFAYLESKRTPPIQLNCAIKLMGTHGSHGH